MIIIKFGTDGWRAIIGDDFTVSNVKRVAQATADWLLKHYKNPKVVVGHDCRFGGKLFSETVSTVFGNNGIKVLLAEGFVSTPMISLGTKYFTAEMGVVITASHNPAEYNGYKLKAHYGGPCVPSVISEVESLIQDSEKNYTKSFSELCNSKVVSYVNLETLYCKRVADTFDLVAIKKISTFLAYDAMYGAGQNVIKNLLPETEKLHCDYNPSFMGQAPEPIHRNLTELCNLLKKNPRIKSGLATDGDADRIGMYDEDGNFIDSHHIILLLIYYLVRYKNQTGKVITTFSCTQKIKELCRILELPHQITKIGFKYISEYMSDPKENILLGGEESGGIAVKGHIPERDGIWMGLILWEYMVKSGKSIKQLIKDIYKLVGPFAVERSDLHLEEHIKQKIINNCKNGFYRSFGSYMIMNTETLDGFKFHFHDNEWTMLRPSGTEPVLRIYAESQNTAKALRILDAVTKTILA